MSSRRTTRSLVSAGSWLAATLGLAACNFEVPSSSYLEDTKLIGVLIEVVELGPLNPDRVGVPSEVPIAEAMPQDRLAFEAVVVDREGRQIPAAELDSLWFQCGPFACGESMIEASSELFDRPCAELEDELLPWNMDAVCRLGAGDGRFEFRLPELSQLLIEIRVAQYYGVIAWAGRSAESCWSARRSGDASLDNCGFIQRSVKIGPSWWMLAYAETVGLQSPIPIPQIPAGVYLQPANRVPVASLVVTVDGEARGGWPEQTEFEVEPGARIEIASEYDEVAQFLQAYFLGKPSVSGDGYLFVPNPETLGEVPYTSNAIVLIEPEAYSEESLFPTSWEFVVDEYAEPGTSRIVMLYFDDRYGEGVAILEFEVRP